MSSPDALRCTLSEEDGMVRGTSFTANTRLTLMQIARGGAGDDEQATRNEDDGQQPAAPAPTHRRRKGGSVYAIRR